MVIGAPLFRHDGHDRAGIRLGVLPADRLGAANFHGGAVLPRRIRRNFAIFSLWLPELFGTEALATASAFCTPVLWPLWTRLGTPIALGLLIVPYAHETRGETLPE
jgi:hypothetical protein